MDEIEAGKQVDIEITVSAGDISDYTQILIKHYFRAPHSPTINPAIVELLEKVVETTSRRFPGFGVGV